MPNIVGFSNPIINSRVKEIYSQLYGANGADFVNVLEDCPYEVAALSILTAYLKLQLRGRR